MSRTEPVPPSRWLTIITRAFITLGVTLFLLGTIGATTGAYRIPFDEHHVFSQLLGLALLTVGLGRLR